MSLLARGGISLRVGAILGLVVAVVAFVSVVLFGAILDLSRSAAAIDRSGRAISAAYAVERLADSGARGAAEQELRELERLVRGDPDQERNVALLGSALHSGSAGTVGLLAEDLRDAAEATQAERHATVGRTERRALTVAGAGLGGWLLLIGLTWVYVRRRVVRPFRALTDAAAQLTEDDLYARVHVEGSDEAGALAARFNEMVDRLSAARRDLIRERDRMAAVAAHFPGGVVALFDHDLRVLLADGALLAAAGFTKETVEGRTIVELLPAGEGETLARHLRAALEGAERSFEWEWNGRAHHIVAAPVRRDDGAVIAGLLATRDITHRKRTETALREANDRFEQAFDNSPIGEALVSLDGRWLRVNPMLESMLGWQPQDFRQLTSDEMTHPDDVERLQAANAQLLAGEISSFQLELRRLHRDGREVPTLQTGSLVRDLSGNPLYLFVQTIDLSEQKRHERERRTLDASLHERQRLESLGVLAGGIAHDFNNLLVGVVGGGELLYDRLEDGRDRQLARQILLAGRRAAELTREMLAYSGRGPFVVVPLDLTQVVRDLVELTRSAIPKAAHLRLDLDLATPAVRADTAQLHQLVLNLITNAAEALVDGRGEITVTTGSVEADAAYLRDFALDAALEPALYATLEVRDTGCGFGPEVGGRIFDPFFTTKETGRGLGLAGVIGTIRGHLGGIRVESEPGAGTCFTVLLPAERTSAAAQPAPAATPRQAASTGRALLADDEATVRLVTAEMLEGAGYVVVQADSGTAALDAFREAPDSFQLVVLDLTMPGPSGEETARAIRRDRPRTPIVIMSGYSSEALHGQLVRDGLVAFLEKPFTPQELATALERAHALAVRL